MSIDNSSWVRLWLATALAEHGIKVITADTTEAANELLLRHKCDLITLDLSNHGQSGTNWLLQIRKKGIRTPVIVLTDASAEHAPAVLDALSGGSQDYVSRSQLGKNPTEFVDRIKSLVQSHRTRIDSESQPTTFSDFKSRPLKQLVRPDVILVGASTGGTDALCQLLTKMPKGCPPVVAVQHIPREFSKAFLDRVGRASGLIPSSPEKGKEILGDHVYLSISDAHIGVRQNGDRLSVYYSHGDKLAGHRPSVDYLFQTASFLRGKKVLACLLTGMGRDGAQGLLELKRNGALTLAQDESTSVVWGMPGEAMKLGAPMVLGSVRELREIIVQSIRAGKNSTPLKTG